MDRIMLYNTNDPESREKLRLYINGLNDLHPGEKVTYRIEVIKNRAIRSVKANRYYRTVLRVIAIQTGETEDNLHTYYKFKYNSDVVMGDVIGVTTSDLDTKEFSEYVKQVKEDGRRHGCYFMEQGDQAYAVWERASKNQYYQMFD